MGATHKAAMAAQTTPPRIPTIHQLNNYINDNNLDELPIVAPIIDPIDIEQEMNERYGTRTTEHELRPRRARDYSHLHTVFTSTILSQYSMKKVSSYMEMLE